MKKIINGPDTVVSDMLKGLSLAHPSLKYLPGVEVITRADRTEKVGLVSGGGSGHEPAHAGYVGKGMLDAAVSGNVFASPSADRVLEGIKAADSGKGVLLIIKNYSGDIMNFSLAAELAEMEGITTASVVVRDDVAVKDSTYSTGRRGIAGTVFVHKIAGAAAEAGASLDEVKRVAEKTVSRIRSMGMAMSPCILPAVGKAGFVLGENEIEIGMGIHGEPGVERSPVLTAAELARVLTDRILADYDYSGKKIAVMVNGLGATPLMELYILYGEVAAILAGKGIGIANRYVGNFMTSLEMAGASVTFLDLDDELESLLNAPSSAPAFLVPGGRS